jgi:hypothetical protein
MTRPYDTLGRRILRVLEPECGGPRKKNVLLGMADPKRVERVLRRLMDAGLVVMIGDKKGARYALAEQ